MPPTKEAQDKVKKYTEEIQWSLRKYRPWHDQVNMWLSYYRNKPKVYTKGGQKVISPLGTSAIDAMFASLTAVNVDIAAEPRGFTSRQLARVIEMALSTEWQRAKAVERLEPAIKDGLLTGIGWGKVWFDYAEEQRMRHLDEYDEDEEYTEVLRDRVVVDWVPWDDILWDPEAKRVEDIRWIVQRYELPLEQVKEDERYDAQARAELVANSRIRDDWRDTSRPEEVAAHEERVVLYERYDVDTGQRCTFPRDQVLLLEEAPNPYSLFLDNEDKFPFFPLILRSDPGEIVGISDMKVMKPALDEINVLRSSLATYVERFKPKVIAREGSFTEAGKRALRSQEWGEVVETTPNTQGGDVSPLVPPGIPQEAFAQDAKAQEDVRNGIGLNELLQGQLPTGRKTATGMSILADASTIRQSEKRNRLERFYIQAARKMLFLMQLFYDEKRITTLVEPDSDVVWSWSAEDISADVAIDVVLSPKQSKDHNQRKEDVMMVLNVLGAHPMVNQEALIAYVMEEFGLPLEVVRTLIKTPEQTQQEQLGALQMQAAGAQVDEGLPPDPSMVPGPLPGSALGTEVNPGELPPGMV